MTARWWPEWSTPGVPEVAARVIVSFPAAARQGLLGSVSSAVPDLTGAPAAFAARRRRCLPRGHGARLSPGIARVGRRGEAFDPIRCAGLLTIFQTFGQDWVVSVTTS